MDANEQPLYEDFHGRFGTFEEVFERNQKELMDSRRKHHDPNCAEPNCAYVHNHAADREAEHARLEKAVVEAAKAMYLDWSMGNSDKFEADVKALLEFEKSR